MRSGAGPKRAKEGRRAGSGGAGLDARGTLGLGGAPEAGASGWGRGVSSGGDGWGVAGSGRNRKGETWRLKGLSCGALGREREGA